MRHTDKGYEMIVVASLTENCAVRSRLENWEMPKEEAKQARFVVYSFYRSTLSAIFFLFLLLSTASIKVSAHKRAGKSCKMHNAASLLLHDDCHFAECGLANGIQPRRIGQQAAGQPPRGHLSAFVRDANAARSFA